MTLIFSEEQNEKGEIHQQVDMELDVLDRRAKRQGRNPSTGAKMRRAKRDGRNPSTGATLSERFENRRAKRNGRNPATGA